MKSAALKINNAAAYCFQVCGPVSSRFSNHANRRGGWYLPSMIQVIYLLIGIARIVVRSMTEIGRDHMAVYLVRNSCPAPRTIRDESVQPVDMQKRKPLPRLSSRSFFKYLRSFRIQ